MRVKSTYFGVFYCLLTILYCYAYLCLWCSFHNRAALDYLTKIEELDFEHAVKMLAGGNLFVKFHQPVSFDKQEIQKKEIRLPPKAQNNNKAVKYLESRGLSGHTAKRAIASGILYESVNGSCVFVGQESRYAHERGIGNDMKKDAQGSDKRYGFCIPANDRGSKVLAVFESPIDALAHYEICRLDGNKWDGYRLSLGGVSSNALDHFIERNPDIRVIQLCLDNDSAGVEASTKITKQMIKNKTAKGRTITINPPPKGKDYLDYLAILKSEAKGRPRQQPDR